MDTNYNIRKIFTFFFCICALVFVFTVPVRADGEGSSFNLHESYTQSDGTLVEVDNTLVYDSPDVITFLFLKEGLQTDKYGNQGYPQYLCAASLSSFNISEQYHRYCTAHDFSEVENYKKSSTDYGSYHFYYTPHTLTNAYNYSLTGKYIIVQVSNFDNINSILSNYFSGNGIDGIIEDHTQEALPVDVDTVGYLQNVTVTQLATTKDGEYLRLSFSPTTTTGLSLDESDIQYQIRTQSYFHVGDEIGKSYHNMSPLDMFRVGNYYYDFLRDDVTGDMDSQEPASTVINANFFDKKALVGIGHTQTFYYGVTFYLRPVVNGSVGGWTEVFLDGSNEDLDLGFLGSSTNNTGISDDYELTIDSSITSILPTQNPNIGFGYGNTINDAVSDSDFNINIGDASNPIESAEDMINMITKFPTLFSRLFSFLPGWCLNLIAISFGMAAILLVVKIVRG